jgi:hypothetical protein
MGKEEPLRVNQDVMSGSTTDGDNDGIVEELSNQEKPSDGSTATVEAVIPEHEYITGVKLLLVITSVTLVAFLMMLDMSIIVTVGFDFTGLEF